MSKEYSLHKNRVDLICSHLNAYLGFEMETGNLDYTKITVKIYEPLLIDLDNRLRKLYIKRDDFINHMIKAELPFLAEELANHQQTSKARTYISGELKRLGTKTINIVVEKSTANQLNDIVKKTNMVRDAFMNRLFLFIRSSTQLLTYLDLPQKLTSSTYERFIAEAMPTTPLEAIEEIYAEPLYYHRLASIERYGVGLYKLELPQKLAGFSCYMANEEVPNTPEYLEAQAKSELALNLLFQLEDGAFGKSSDKNGG